MNEKEMLMKQLRANAFPHNNGKVMQPKSRRSCAARAWTPDARRSGG